MTAYIKTYNAHTNQSLFDNTGQSTQRYSRYETGKIMGNYRDMPTLIADETGFDGMGFNAHVGSPDDNFHLVNLFDNTHKYVETVAIAGAMDIDHAITLAVNQFDHLNSGNVQYGVLVANDSEFDSFDGMGWSSDTVAKLMKNPSQDSHYLPIVTKKALLAEQARATAEPVMWDGIALISHNSEDTRLLLDMQKNDAFGELTAKFDMAQALANMSIEQPEFDALIETNNRLDMMKERIFTAMSRASIDGLAVTNATLTQPFKRQGVANVAMQFDLSDGQAIVIWFHNPDADPKKLAAGDMMVSWKWMLNKRDITAAVSPKNGENVQVPQLAVRMMKVAAKNSKRFAAAQAKKAENQKALADAQKAVEDKTTILSQLDTDIADLTTQIEEAGKVQAKSVVSDAPLTNDGLNEYDQQAIEFLQQYADEISELEKRNVNANSVEDSLKFSNDVDNLREKTSVNYPKDGMGFIIPEYDTSTYKKYAKTFGGLWNKRQTIVKAISKTQSFKDLVNFRQATESGRINGKDINKKSITQDELQQYIDNANDILNNPNKYYSSGITGMSKMKLNQNIEQATNLLDPNEINTPSSSNKTVNQTVVEIADIAKADSSYWASNMLGREDKFLISGEKGRDLELNKKVNKAISVRFTALTEGGKDIIKRRILGMDYMLEDIYPNQKDLSIITATNFDENASADDIYRGAKDFIEENLVKFENLNNNAAQILTEPHSSIVDDLLAMGLKTWGKDDKKRIYMSVAQFNKITGYDYKLSDSNNKIFYDYATNAIMRSYKGKKPTIEVQHADSEQVKEQSESSNKNSDDLPLDEIRNQYKQRFDSNDTQWLEKYKKQLQNLFTIRAEFVQDELKKIGFVESGVSFRMENADTMIHVDGISDFGWWATYNFDGEAEGSIPDLLEENKVQALAKKIIDAYNKSVSNGKNVVKQIAEPYTAPIEPVEKQAKDTPVTQEQQDIDYLNSVAKGELGDGKDVTNKIRQILKDNSDNATIKDLANKAALALREITKAKAQAKLASV